MSPPAFQRAERTVEAVRSESFVPSPDAALGDGDGAARHPYQRHGTVLSTLLKVWNPRLKLAGRSAIEPVEQFSRPRPRCGFSVGRYVAKVARLSGGVFACIFGGVFYGSNRA